MRSPLREGLSAPEGHLQNMYQCLYPSPAAANAAAGPGCFCYRYRRAAAHDAGEDTASLLWSLFGGV